MSLEIGARAPSLRERRRQRTRQELIDAVLQVIAESGLEGATIERVSKASAISRGTVYAHFPGGRDELLRSAYGQLGTDLVARTRDAVDTAADWRGRLEAHAREMLALADDAHLGHFFNVSGPTLIVSGEARGIGSGASVAMIREDLIAAQARGEIESSIDPDMSAVLLVGALREAAIQVASGAGERGRVFRAFARLVAGLGASE